MACCMTAVLQGEMELNDSYYGPTISATRGGRGRGGGGQITPRPGGLWGLLKILVSILRIELTKRIKRMCQKS